MDGLEFAWDENKRIATIEKHGIDFAQVIEIFESDHLIIPARSETEDRFAAVAKWNGMMVTVIFTKRDDLIRLITARRARQNERDLYHAHHTRRSAQT